MARRREVSNLLALAVLAYLNRGPMHPYEVGRTLQEHGDDRSIRFNRGSLYMVFEQLARAGFVEAGGTEREGGRPERTVYAITDAGRAELRDWLRELLEEPEHEFPRFVAALSLLAALPPEEVVTLLRQRLDRLAEQRREIRDLVDATQQQGVHPLFLVEEEYRVTLLDAEASFVAELVDRIEDPNEGWAELWTQLHATAGDGNADDEDTGSTPAQEVER